MELKYTVLVETPLGAKTGTLEMTVINSEITGFIELLGVKNAVIGELCSDGNCSLDGMIKTPVRYFEFCANGYADTEKIELVLSNGSHSYKLTGKAKKEGQLE